jgi:ribosomal protein S18 acetylase RimI-like enzyme
MIPAGPIAIGWRPSAAEDDAFLRGVFAGTRRAEIAALGGDGPAARTFVDMQYDFQARSYRARFPTSSCSVVERLDGGRVVPIGRLWIDREPRCVRVLDICLLPEHRGAGCGEALLRGLLEEARAGQQVVRLQVARDNPARRLYERLGFVVEHADELHLGLCRDPARTTALSMNPEPHHEQA